MEASSPHLNFKRTAKKNYHVIGGKRNEAEQHRLMTQNWSAGPGKPRITKVDILVRRQLMGPQHGALQSSNGTFQPTISYYDTSKIMPATEQGFRQMSMGRAKGKM